MTHRHRRALSLQRLDDRITPAIAVQLTPTGVLNISGFPANALNLTQTANNAINVKDGVVNYGTYLAPGGLNVLVARFNQAILFDVGNFTYTGNVNIDMGLGSTYAGLREVSVFDSNGTTGGLGKVAANVTVKNGNGSEYIAIGRPAVATGSISLPVQVNGSVFISTRNNAGPDTFELTAGSIVQTNITTTNIDIVTIGVYDPGSPQLAKVGGSVICSNPAPAVAFLVDAYATIGGSLVATSTAGSFKANSLLIEDGTTIGGGVTASFANGNNIFFGSLAPGQPAPVIGGDVNCISGVGSDLVLMIDDPTDGDNATLLGNFSANLGQGDNEVSYDSAAFTLGNMNINCGNGGNNVKGAISTYFAGYVGGNLTISLGNGDNNIDFGGTVAGNQIVFQTGGGDDTVGIRASAFAPSARLYVYLNGGDDLIEVSSTNFSSAYINGGPGFADDFNPTVIIPITWTVLGFEL